MLKLISYNSACIYSKSKTKCIKDKVKCLLPEIYSLVFINGFLLIAKYSFYYSSAYVTWNCLLFIFHGSIGFNASGNSGNVVKILLLCVWHRHWPCMKYLICTKHWWMGFPFISNELLQSAHTILYLFVWRSYFTRISLKMSRCFLKTIEQRAKEQIKLILLWLI